MPRKSKSDQDALAQWQAEKASGTPASEHALNAFKAVLAAIPFAGVLGSLLTDYIPSFRTRRLEAFAEHLAEDLRKLKDDIDENYLRTEDFAFMFQSCLRAAADAPQPEKQDTFRAILVNSMVSQGVSELEKEYFLGLAIRLSALHLQVLRFMWDPVHYLANRGMSAESIRGGMAQVLSTAIPDASRSTIEAAFGDLFHEGLLNTDKNIFGMSTSAQGVRLAQGRVTEIGQRFMSFATTATVDSPSVSV